MNPYRRERRERSRLDQGLRSFWSAVASGARHRFGFPRSDSGVCQRIRVDRQPKRRRRWRSAGALHRSASASPSLSSLPSVRSRPGFHPAPSPSSSCWSSSRSLRSWPRCCCPPWARPRARHRRSSARATSSNCNSPGRCMPTITTTGSCPTGSSWDGSGLASLLQHHQLLGVRARPDGTDSTAGIRQGALWPYTQERGHLPLSFRQIAVVLRRPTCAAPVQRRAEHCHERQDQRHHRLAQSDPRVVVKLRRNPTARQRVHFY